MTAPSTLTMVNDPGLGVVIMHDGTDIGGQNVVFHLTDDEQPLNRGTLSTAANKFSWPEALYAGTVKLKMDYNEPGVTTTLEAELELLTDVFPWLLTGEFDPGPPPVTQPTGVTPGAPGAFTPPGSTVPADLAALTTLGALGQVAAWAETYYVDLGDASTAHWNGTAWAAGAAGPAGDPGGQQFDPEDHTIAEVRSYISGLDDEGHGNPETQRVLDRERATQDRATLVDWLDRKLGAV